MKKKNHAIDLIGFLAILLVLIMVSSYLIKPKEYDAYNLSVVSLKTKALSYEDENSIDVIFAGNSESCYTFSPLQLWGEHGITSYDTGSGAQRLCDTYAILVETFKRQSPKLVVLETDSIFEEYPGIYKDDNEFDNMMEKLFPILHYHSFYNGIQLPKFVLNFTENRRNESLYKGFQVRDTIEGFAGEPYVYDFGDYVITDEGIEYINKIKELCSANGSRLVLVSAPSAINWNENKYKTISSWAEDNGVMYVDLNKNNEEVGIDWTYDTYDAGVHVNIYGSMKATSYIGNILKENFDLEDYRHNPAYNKWHDDYKNAGLY
ncbi:MAG: hypothetical protein Q4F06_02865 [Eubacteriales bacterium]|nr:hypothetical protein [Eubacteriales bacterium]